MSLTFVLALFLGSCQPSIRENPWEHLPHKSVATSRRRRLFLPQARLVANLPDIISSDFIFGKANSLLLCSLRPEFLTLDRRLA